MEFTSFSEQKISQEVQAMKPTIKETQNHFLVMFLLPQFKKEELKIEIRQHQRLIVSDLLGNLLKSGLRFSRKEFFPSLASSLI